MEYQLIIIPVLFITKKNGYFLKGKNIVFLCFIKRILLCKLSFSILNVKKIFRAISREVNPVKIKIFKYQKSKTQLHLNRKRADWVSGCVTD